jgi:hypothetical protein
MCARREMLSEVLLRPNVNGPIPIVIGVRGHRDLRDEDLSSLREAVRKAFEFESKAAPHTRITVLTSLADGADRLVAAVAAELGHTLIVALPCSVDDFKPMLRDDDARRDFDDLLSKAATHFTAPCMNLGVDLERAPFDVQDDNCGAYIVSHCWKLLALWDGSDWPDASGTAMYVMWKLEGVPESVAGERSELDAAIRGPVEHIMTPHGSNPEPAGRLFSRESHYPRFVGPSEDRAKLFGELLQRLDAFNEDALNYDASTSGSASPEQLRTIAGAVARTYQRRTLSALRLILFVVGVTALCFTIYTHGLVITRTASLVLVGGTLVAACVAGGIHWFAHRNEWQDRYEDYRALAEAFRISGYWERAGVNASVADELMRLQRGELDWVSLALRSATPLEPVERKPSSHVALREVVEKWIDGQADWFGKRIDERTWLLGLSFWTVRVLLLITLGLLVASLVALFVTVDAGDSSHRKWLFTLGTMFAIVAALMQFYRERRSWAEERQGYRRAHALFLQVQARLKPLLEDVIDEAEMRSAQRLLYDLGVEALRENNDWRNLHRQRPIEIPVP